MVTRKETVGRWAAQEGQLQPDVPSGGTGEGRNYPPLHQPWCWDCRLVSGVLTRKQGSCHIHTKDSLGAG